MGRVEEGILEEGTRQVCKQKFGGCGLSGKEVTCHICLLSQVPGKPCRKARMKTRGPVFCCQPHHEPGLPVFLSVKLKDC